jgi:hypothetical protein
MTRRINHTEYNDFFEYHGNTAIEVTRKKDGLTISHDWLIFDTVEEAEGYFNDYC